MVKKNVPYKLIKVSVKTHLMHLHSFELCRLAVQIYKHAENSKSQKGGWHLAWKRKKKIEKIEDEKRWTDSKEFLLFENALLGNSSGFSMESLNFQ